MLRGTFAPLYRQAFFHAAEDSLETRGKAFPVLKAHSGDARVYSLAIEKAGPPDSERSQAALFGHAATALIGSVVEAERVRDEYSWNHSLRRGFAR